MCSHWSSVSYVSFCCCTLSSPNPSRHLTKVNFGDAASAAAEGEDGEGGGGGGGAAVDKKISAEELFESVCSLKAAQTQMQLHDGKERRRTINPHEEQLLNKIIEELIVH